LEHTTLTAYVVTLHQPRSDIYHTGINNVVVLAKGGRTAYSGPRKSVESAFAAAGYPIPHMFNPADWLLDVVSVDARGRNEEKSRQRVSQLLDYWHEQEQRKRKESEERENSVVAEKVEISAEAESYGKAPMWVALPVVIERMVKNL
jgi:hypothetical protein